MSEYLATYSGWNSAHCASASHTMRGHAAILLIVTCGLIEPAFAVNFTQCLADVRSGVHGTHGGTDAYGHPVSISDAVGITYSLCKSACETGPEPFKWHSFSQEFNAWLLPWLALISQLPFGTRDRFENLTSVLLAVGSPTLVDKLLVSSDGTLQPQQPNMPSASPPAPSRL